MIKDRVFIWGGLAVLATAVYTALTLPKLPDQIPVHWGVNGQPDRYSDKGSGAWFMVGMMVVLWLVFLAIPYISTKTKSISNFRDVWDLTAIYVVAFMGMTQVITLMGPQKNFDVVRVMMAAMCLLFTLIGNLLGKTTPNYFMGIRTPWTLESPEVWERTHRLAARLMVGGGVVGFILSLAGAYWIGLGLVLAGTIYPVFYSYFLYKKIVGSNGVSSS